MWYQISTSKHTTHMEGFLNKSAIASTILYYFPKMFTFLPHNLIYLSIKYLLKFDNKDISNISMTNVLISYSLTLNGYSYREFR